MIDENAGGENKTLLITQALEITNYDLEEAKKLLDNPEVLIDLVKKIEKKSQEKGKTLFSGQEPVANEIGETSMEEVEQPVWGGANGSMEY